MKIFFSVSICKICLSTKNKSKKKICKTGWVLGAAAPIAIWGRLCPISECQFESQLLYFCSNFVLRHNPARQQIMAETLGCLLTTAGDPNRILGFWLLWVFRGSESVNRCSLSIYFSLIAFQLKMEVSFRSICIYTCITNFSICGAKASTTCIFKY